MKEFNIRVYPAFFGDWRMAAPGILFGAINRQNALTAAYNIARQKLEPFAVYDADNNLSLIVKPKRVQ